VHSSGREQRYIRFLVLSSEPIFSFQDSKKAWLIAVVLSLGNAMNGQTDVKTGELYVADADVKTNVAYALPVDLAKSLQKKTRSRSGSWRCRALRSTCLIEFPFRRLSGVVRRRCFRST